MIKLYIMYGADWSKIRLYVLSSMLEVMSRVHTVELCETGIWYWSVYD